MFANLPEGTQRFNLLGQLIHYEGIDVPVVLHDVTAALLKSFRMLLSCSAFPAVTEWEVVLQCV